MNNEEAAKELGISVRSLQRAVKAGRVGVGYQRGKSGKMEAVYDPREITRYKRELTEIIRPDSQEVAGASLALTTRDADVTRIVGLIKDAFSVAANKSKPSVPVEHKLLLTLDEAAQLSGVSRGQLREEIRRKRLKGRIIGRGFKVKRADLDAFVKKL